MDLHCHRRVDRIATKKSHRLGIGVRKPACHRAFGGTRPHALERVANKTDEHLALAESAVGVMNGSPVCIVTYT